MEETTLSTKNKALQINLNPQFYGTIAEIGGGQEVSRHFFQAGGASGTIAKTISAYDKTFSDVFYNKGKQGRYVSEQRLGKMLQMEFEELVSTLGPSRDADTRFFVFADTVETLNYHKTNSGQGWLGVRFRLNPEKEASTVVIHANLLENDGILQQYTLGALGINLIYACFHYYDRPNSFLRSLLDNLDRDRVDINYIRMEGPDFEYIDNRLLSVQLVKNGMTHAVMFDRYGNVQHPSDMLYKKNVLVLRGSFRPITYVGFDMLKTSSGQCRRDSSFERENTVVLCEMNIKAFVTDNEVNERDFLDRVDLLNGMGQNVMVSDFLEFYKLSRYFGEMKLNALRLIVGANTLMKVFDSRYYEKLKGGILEAMGMLFESDTRLLVYPFLDPIRGELISVANFPLPSQLQSLYQYLIDNGKIIGISHFRRSILHIHSQDVLRRIHADDASWENDVPVFIAEAIKKKKLFR